MILIFYYLNSSIFRSSSNILIQMISVSFPPNRQSPFLFSLFDFSFITSLVIMGQIEEKQDLWVLNTSFSHVVLLFLHIFLFYALWSHKNTSCCLAIYSFKVCPDNSGKQRIHLQLLAIDNHCIWQDGILCVFCLGFVWDLGDGGWSTCG